MMTSSSAPMMLMSCMVAETSHSMLGKSGSFVDFL